MRVWFVAYASEHETYNDLEPGEPGYEYEVLDPAEDELIFIQSALFATEKQAVHARNKLYIEKYDKEVISHRERVSRYNKKKEAIDLLILAGISPEDLFPYGIGAEPTFSLPTIHRIGYMEVVEDVCPECGV